MTTTPSFFKKSDRNGAATRFPSHDGLDYGSRQYFPRTKQSAWFIPVLLVINFCMLNFDSASAHVIKTSIWRCNGLTFQKTTSNWHGQDRASIEVRRNGKLLLRRQAHDLWFWTLKNGEFVEAEDKDPFETVDLNGDGIKDFVIRQWTGGAYCCYTYEVFSMAKNCPRLWFDEAKCAHLKIILPKTSSNVTKRQTRRPAVLAMEDGSFLYWRTYSLDGPRPIVYLTWNHSGKPLPIQQPSRRAAGACTLNIDKDGSLSYVFVWNSRRGQ